jgi:lysophospholipid acyltransferase (LPLAT)-like uncharacterized protein
MSPPTQNTTPTAARPKPGGSVVPHAPTFLQRAVAWLVWALIRTCTATLRFRIQDRSGLFDGSNPGPIIFCVWHNRLATCLSGYYAYARKRNRTLGMAAIVSASKDGGFLTAILERFGVQPVRGSSSRRGRQAMLELITWAEQGYDLAITPDGPRGPRYKIQQGVMTLAQLTGRPILPAAYNLAWKISIKSWDKFQVPIPFSLCEVIVERPVRVPREAKDEEREMLRRGLEQTLNTINRD